MNHKRSPIRSSTPDRWSLALERWEPVANWISDQDAEWWPFGFLRPREEERLSVLRIVALALLRAIPVSFLLLLLGRHYGEPVRTVDLVLLPLCASVVFVALYLGTFGLFWNRRADRIATMRRRSRE